MRRAITDSTCLSLNKSYSEHDCKANFFTSLRSVANNASPSSYLNWGSLYQDVDLRPAWLVREHWELRKISSATQRSTFSRYPAIVQENICRDTSRQAAGGVMGSRILNSSSRFNLSLCKGVQARPHEQHISYKTLGVWSKVWSVIRTLSGSFSAVSKPIFASKYSLESSRRDLHNALLCTVLESTGVL